MGDKITKMLQDKLCLKLLDVTLECDIPYKVLLQVITERIPGSILNDRGDVLYIDEAVDRCKAIIMGITTAALKPIPLASMRARVERVDLFYKDIFDVAIQNNQFPGKIVKSYENFPASFVPNCYEEQLENHIKTTLNTSGLINYNFYKQCGIRDVLKFAKRVSPEQLYHVDTCCIKSSMRENINLQLFAALLTNHYVDLITILPEEFEKSDFRAFLRGLDLSVNKISCQIMKERWIISEDYVDYIHDKLKTDMTNYAHMHLEEFKALQIESENLTFVAPINRQQGNKGRKDKAKKGHKRKTEESNHDFKNNYQKGNLFHFFSQDEYFEFFKLNFPSSEDLYKVVINILEDKVLHEFQFVVKEMIEDSKKMIYCDLKVQITLIREYISIWIPRILCYDKALQCLTKEPLKIRALFEKHLFKSLGLPLVDFVLQQCAIRENVIENNYLIDSDKTRTSLLEKLDLSLRNDFIPIYDTFKTNIFVELFEGLVYKQFGLSPPKLDKKIEKEVVLANRNHLRDFLKVQRTESVLFLTAVSLLFNSVHNMTLLIPGKCVGGILRMLKESMTPSEYDLLRRCEVIAVDKLKAGGRDLTLSDEFCELKNIILEKYC